MLQRPQELDDADRRPMVHAHGVGDESLVHQILSEGGTIVPCQHLATLRRRDDTGSVVKICFHCGVVVDV